MRFFSRGKADTKEQKKSLHGGLPPSFHPSAVARSITSQIANASQHANEYLANASLGVRQALPSITFRDMAPIRMTCRNWDDGAIFDWYKRQRYTTISKLELRKERDRFKHEYIVIYLDNGWLYRVERRPVGGANTATISKEGCEAEDSLTPVSDDDLKSIRYETDAEITLEFGSNKPDLYNVIAVAVAIHFDPRTKNFTLQQYNCLFFARSIIALVTRHCLLQSSPTNDLRWDRVTESMILTHVFDGNWDKLETLLKAAMISVLGKLIWDIVKENAGTRIEKRKDWDRLKHIVNKVIRDEVDRCDVVAGDEIPKAVTEWIIQATQATLWHGNLQQSLSQPKFSNKYETMTACSLNEMVKPQLEADLPGNMIQGVSIILPERLITRIRPSALAYLPPELLARLPIRVLEKLPDNFLAKLPNDLLRSAPKEFLQNLPVHVYSRMRDAVVLTLPDDLGIVPPMLLEMALPRMQNLLDEPNDNPDRKHAFELLRRLPTERFTQLSPKYTAMREELEEGTIPPVNPTTPEQLSDQARAPRVKSFRRTQKRRDELSILGSLIRISPIAVLKHLPIIVMDALPLSLLQLLPASALERIPPKYMGKMSNHWFERLPRELLAKLPETLLLKLSWPTLERLPASLLERLPAEWVRNMPAELLENIPEDLTSLLRQAIKSDVFEGEELKQELREQVEVILRRTLIASSGDLPTSLIRASIRVHAKQKNDVRVKKHEELQMHILDMVRGHSKTVAQVSLLGVSEESVYNGLRYMMEEIWRVVRLHPFPSKVPL